MKPWPTRTRTTRIHCRVLSSDKPGTDCYRTHALDPRHGCSLTTNSRWECLRRKTFPRPWPFTHDLNRNRISSWPDCGTCLHKFWFTFLRWFRSCRVHKMSMTFASCLTLILTQWPWTYRRCLVDLVVSITVISFVIIRPSIPKLGKHASKNVYLSLTVTSTFNLLTSKSKI